MSTEHLNFREVLDFGIGCLSPSPLLLLAIPTSVFSSSLFLFIHNVEGGRETGEGEPVSRHLHFWQSCD